MKKHSKSVSDLQCACGDTFRGMEGKEDTCPACLKKTLHETSGKVARGHEYVCDECGKQATWNVQSQFHEYSIDENGDFTETDCWEGGENEFLCDECHQHCSL